MSLDNLTQLQKIAIEGEISQALYTSIHDEDVLYRLYTILKKTPKEIGYFVLEIVKNLTDISEEKLYKVIAEVSSDEFPTWIWTNKVIADIKFSLRVATAEKNISEANINKKEIQQKILTSAFVYYCRSIAVQSPEAATKLCEAILADETAKVEFLESTCFSLMEEIKELPPKKKIPEKILHTSVNVQNILSYNIETKMVSSQNTKILKESATEKLKKDIQKLQIKTHNLEKDLSSDSVKVELDKGIQVVSLEKGINILKNLGLLDDDESDDEYKDVDIECVNQTHKEVNTKYSVIKFYKDIGVSTTLKSFETEEEAIQYIENINRNFPDLTKTCELLIHEEPVQSKGKK